MVHYVPFKEDLSDLAEKIEWLQNNDAVAERIARNAEAFVHKSAEHFRWERDSFLRK